MSLEFLHTKFEKVSYLATLLASRASGGVADDAEYMALRHEVLADQEIASQIPSFVRLNRDLSSFWSFIQPKFKTYAERRTFISEQFTPVLDYLELVAIDPNAANVTKTPQGVNIVSMGKIAGGVLPISPVARNKRKVFIVHGRDDAAKQEVARFISDVGLIPIILHEQANAGMTIIEKIEHYTNDADFALVLYTPCDRGRGEHERSIPARQRARQNVVFEHGYLMAKLGRENVCALVKGEIETPNDISGVVYVTLDGYGSWKASVEKELKACGYVLKE